MRAFALLILLAGCGGAAEDQPANGAANRAAAPTAPPPSAQDVALSRGAADALRLYYERIGRRDWSGAFAMREPAPGLTLERFAANYERYRDYRATVGMPSLPARQDKAVWVQVPVQLYGRMRDGSPFGSVGMIVLRRGPGADGWKIQS
jgi:hypothetical protein